MKCHAITVSGFNALLFVFAALLPFPDFGLKAQSASPYPTIDWLSFAEAENRQAQSPKKWLVYIYGEVCPACRRMDAETLSHPAIAEYVNQYFYTVKFDAHQTAPISFNGKTYRYINDEKSGTSANELAYELTFNRLSYPYIVILDEQFNVLQPAPGFRNLQEMMRLLQFFGEDFYKWMDWGSF